MKKIYLVYILLIANFTFAQEFRPSTLDSINNQLKGKSTKDRCLYFLEKADYYSKTNTNYYYLYGKAALKEAVKSQENTLLSRAYNTLGTVFQNKTQLDSSLYYHRQALLIRQNEKDTIGIADSYSNIGIAFDSQGDFDNALKQYFKALPFYEKRQMDEKTAMTSVTIGVVYKTQKEYKKAYFYYKKAYELYTKLKSEFGTTVTSGNLGAILINFEGYNKSLEYSKQAKAGYEKLGYKRYVAYPLSNIAVVYDSLHRFEEANKNYIASITLHEEFANNFEVANICNAFSNCLIKQKKYSESVIYAQKALNYAKVADAKFLEVYALKNLANAYKKFGNFDKAYYYLSLYTNGMDQLFKSEKTKAVFEIEAKYENEKKTKLLLQIQNKIQKRNSLVLILALLITLIGLIIFLIYRQQKIKSLQQAQEFKLKSAIAAVESKNKLQEQRISISRNLHDNIGAQLTFIISSINNIKHGFDINNSKLEDKLQSISSFTKSTIVELRDTIWAMSIEQVSLEDLKLRIFDFIEKARLAVESTQFKFHIASDLLALYFSSIDGMNIYRILQEAVHNSIKYAKATEISVNFSKEKNFIIVKIIDNGAGFEPDSVVQGNGIQNIKKRIKELHGTFDINSQINVGTTLTIRLPYKKFEL